MVVGGTLVEGVINYEMPGSHGGDGCHFMADEYDCGGWCKLFENIIGVMFEMLVKIA